MRAYVFWCEFPQFEKNRCNAVWNKNAVHPPPPRSAKFNINQKKYMQCTKGIPKNYIEKKERGKCSALWSYKKPTVKGFEVHIIWKKMYLQKFTLCHPFKTLKIVKKETNAAHFREFLRFTLKSVAFHFLV